MPDTCSRILSTAVSATMLALLLASSAGAQVMSEEQVQERTAALVERLGLSEAQVAGIKPLIQARNQKFGEIRERYAGDDSRSARRKQFKEARDAQKEFEKAVEPLLSEAQASEWQAMKQEAREKIRERRKESR